MEPWSDSAWLWFLPFRISCTLHMNRNSQLTIANRRKGITATVNLTELRLSSSSVSFDRSWGRGSGAMLDQQAFSDCGASGKSGVDPGATETYPNSNNNNNDLKDPDGNGDECNNEDDQSQANANAITATTPTSSTRTTSPASIKICNDEDPEDCQEERPTVIDSAELNGDKDQKVENGDEEDPPVVEQSLEEAEISNTESDTPATTLPTSATITCNDNQDLDKNVEEASPVSTNIPATPTSSTTTSSTTVRIHTTYKKRASKFMNRPNVQNGLGPGASSLLSNPYGGGAGRNSPVVAANGVGGTSRLFNGHGHHPHSHRVISNSNNSSNNNLFSSSSGTNGNNNNGNNSINCSKVTSTTVNSSHNHLGLKSFNATRNTSLFPITTTSNMSGGVGSGTGGAGTSLPSPGSTTTTTTATASFDPRPPFVTTVTRGRFLPSKFDLMVEKSLFTFSSRPKPVGLITKHQCSLYSGPPRTESNANSSSSGLNQSYQ